MKVTIERMNRLLYRGTTTVLLTSVPGKPNPYRSMFSSNIRTVHRWALSEENAAKRTAKAARKIEQAASEWADKTNKNTTHKEM